MIQALCIFYLYAGTKKNHQLIYEFTCPLQVYPMYKCKKKGHMVIIFNSKKLNKSLGIFNANELHLFLKSLKGIH